MIGTLETTSGHWNAIIFIIVFIWLSIFIYFIWRYGEKTCKHTTQQVKPFLSGNPEPDKEYLHIRSENIFWGFVEGLKTYYNPLVKIHTGYLTDYLILYIFVLSVLFIVVVALSYFRQVILL